MEERTYSSTIDFLGTIRIKNKCYIFHIELLQLSRIRDRKLKIIRVHIQYEISLWEIMYKLDELEFVRYKVVVT